jgi:CheY-like chemotaxis protein
VASTLSGIVSMLGYSVQVAATGAEALAVIPGFQPGVVLLDMDLPDTAGEVVLQRLLQSDPRLPVVLLSGKRALSSRAARSPRARSTTSRSRSTYNASARWSRRPSPRGGEPPAGASDPLRDVAL